VDKIPEPGWLEVSETGVEFLRPEDDVIDGWTQPMIMDLRAEMARRWVDGRQVEPITYRQVIEQFSGAKRNALHRAHHNNRHKLPAGKVEAFVKVDYYSEFDAENKPPRMIQYRGPAYNLELARWLTPAEEELLHGPGLGPTRLPASSKGMTPEERGSVLAAKRYHFRNPVAVLQDYSAFDSTNFAHLLAQEHGTWLEMCPGLNKTLLDAQFRNSCRTKNGIKYTAAGTRMSGDRNTGGGNSVTNHLNFLTICAIARIEAEFICDGDDSIAWMEEEDVPRFIEVSKRVIGRVFGMILKDCTVVGHVDEEYYCQHKNVLCEDGRSRPTRCPVRILTRLPWTPTGVRGSEAADLLAAKLVGEMMVNKHIRPVAEFCRRLLVRMVDMGVNSIKAKASVQLLDNLKHRTGVVIDPAVVESLAWVRDFRIPEDPIALAHYRVLYPECPEHVLSEAFVKEADTVEFHPSMVHGSRKHRKLRQSSALACHLCDLNNISR
jgi:hypothetical protein